MIAYVETRLTLDEGETDARFALYVAHTPEHAVAEVYVRRSAFEGDPPKEIILTVTPA